MRPIFAPTYRLDTGQSHQAVDAVFAARWPCAPAPAACGRTIRLLAFGVTAPPRAVRYRHARTQLSSALVPIPGSHTACLTLSPRSSTRLTASALYSSLHLRLLIRGYSLNRFFLQSLQFCPKQVKFIQLKLGQYCSSTAAQSAAGVVRGNLLQVDLLHHLDIVIPRIGHRVRNFPRPKGMEQIADSILQRELRNKIESQFNFFGRNMVTTVVV